MAADWKPHWFATEKITSVGIDIPGWAREVLSSFEQRTESYMEVDIADALLGVRKSQRNLNDDEWKGFTAEWSAFSSWNVGVKTRSGKRISRP